jgi:hypothetical protein
MPYNFESTFTQPLLTQLDNGLIDGADSWAEAITEAYVNTIKTGLPQGVPVTLPAPGLNPTAPPPFPIGASSFNTADSKKQVMYNIIRAYYLAKEFSLDKASIEGLIVTVKQLIEKIKVRYSQVRALITQVQLITKEVAELPRRIAEIIKDIEDEIKEQIENVKGIFRVIDGYKVEFGEQEFRTIFAEELRLFETFKNFKLTNVAAIRDLTLFVVQHAQQVERRLSVNTPQQIAKKYLRDRLFAIAKEFLKFAEAVIDPTKIIDFLKGLASGRDRIKRVYEKVRRFDFFIRYIQPKLKLLEKRVKDKIKEIRDKLQKKLMDVQKKVQDKIAESLKKKKDSKAQNLYKNAKKNIDDLKKQNKEKIKKVQSSIRLGIKGIQLTTTMVGKVTSLVEGAKLEFETIKKEILDFQKSIEQQIQTISQAGQNIISNVAAIQPPTAPSITNLPTSLPQNISQFNSILGQLDVKKLIVEVKKAKDYFEQSGLGEFANLVALVMTQAKCTFQTFKKFFEAKRDTIKQYVKEITDLERDFKKIINIIKEFQDPEKKNQLDVDNTRVANWLSDRVDSVFEFLKFVIKWLKPKLKKVEKWFKKKVKELKTFITEKLKKFGNDLKIFALNLIPLKSDVQDPKDKVAVAEDKLNKLKDKIEQVKSLITKVSFIVKMSVGGFGFVSNIIAGRYKFSDNQSSIQNFLDGYYSYRSDGQPPAVQEQLQQEKAKVRDDLNGLIIIETVAFGVIETYKDFEQSDFLKELEEFVNTLEQNYPGKRSWERILNIFKQPPTSIKQVVDLANTLTLDLLNDVNILTKLVDLETRYLRRSREAIKSLCDIKRLEGTKTEKALLKIKDVLEKNQSFILTGIKLLQEQLKKLFRFIGSKLKKITDNIKKKLQKKREKVEERSKLELDKIKEKKINIEAPIMTFTFDLAARLFWTGATWTGQTGTQHVVFTIGPFTPIKAKSTDGASAMIREIAKGFENQLPSMTGLLTPPANTGIPPIPFTGYN